MPPQALEPLANNAATALGETASKRPSKAEKRKTKGVVLERKTYGYARVSSREQNLARQIDALEEFGIPPSCIFTDKASGKDFKRPAYARLMKQIAEHDTIVVKSIDRLGRNYDEILEEWRKITKERQVYVVVLDMPLLDTRQTKEGITGVFIADLTLQLLSYVAQIERENIKQRQAEGIAAAQARGVHFGRPRLERPEHYGATKQSYLSGEITKQQAASSLKVSIRTFDRWLKNDANSASLETATLEVSA